MCYGQSVFSYFSLSLARSVIFLFNSHARFFLLFFSVSFTLFLPRSISLSCSLSLTVFIAIAISLFLCSLFLFLRLPLSLSRNSFMFLLIFHSVCFSCRFLSHACTTSLSLSLSRLVLSVCRSVCRSCRGRRDFSLDRGGDGGGQKR